jgi:hypothetical protein
LQDANSKRANHVVAARRTLGKFTSRPLYLGKGHILPTFKGGVGRSYTGRSLTVTFSAFFFSERNSSRCWTTRHWPQCPLSGV